MKQYLSISYCNWWRGPSILAIAIIVMLFKCEPEKKLPDIDYLGQKPPGMVAEIFAPGLISTNSYEHSAPAFSPDGSIVLWTVVDKDYRASMFQMKYEQGKWSTPNRPSFADSTADDYYPAFSADGKKLYFGSRRKAPSGYPGTDMRIWEVERNQNDWKEPMPFDTVVSKGKEYAHSITKNGTLYFSVAPVDGMSMNIQKAEMKNGSYTKPVLLPYSINSVGYEDGPYIAPDESFLIVESQRPEGTDGSLDLYISFKIKEDHWTVPINMGPRINSAFSERFARLSPDGKYLFFGSSRNQSSVNWGFDIYWIDAKVIEELKSEQLAQSAMDQPLGEGIINALHKDDSEGAAGLLKQWLALHPNSVDATVIYSSMLRKMTHYPEAEKLLESNASIWNKNASIIMEMALVKYGMNKDDEAVRLLSPILTDGEHQRDRYMYVANALLPMGMFQKSDEYFTKAMAIHSNMFEYFRRARAYALVDEKDKAFDNLRKALDQGYTSKQDFENEKGFATLRSDARWRELVEKLR